MLWLLFWVLIIAILLSGSGFYGHRRGYYQGRFLWGWLIVIWIVFLIVIFFAPWWGHWWGYRSYWYW